MSLPAPYYCEDGITIYCGDCREIMPALSSRGLVLSDPPYGIAYNRGDRPQAKHRFSRGRQLASLVGDDEPFDPSPWVGGPCILWGANEFYSRLPPGGTWLVWDKVTRNGLALRIGEAEFAWTNAVARSQVFRWLWSGGYRSGGAGDSRLFVHPTQKPVALMRWCIELWDRSDPILDPFMGSGTTLVAAKQLGRKAVGIEIEERYCEVAVQRLAQGVLPLEAP